MNHYTWKVEGVTRTETPALFANNLETALNALEQQEFEVYDVMDVQGKPGGVVVVGRKPRRFPKHIEEPPVAPSARLDPRRLRGL